MSSSWKYLARQAMRKSAEIRAKHRLGASEPICIYDLCQKESVMVQFIPVSMEGLYIRENKTILLGSMRPLPRRNFTCGHELGHHIFGHGSRLDQILNADKSSDRRTDPDEFLVNTFAGFLLMPSLAIRKAFVSRGWNVKSPTPEQIFTIACSFRVGYETLVNHMVYSAEIISGLCGTQLLKTKPKQIKKSLLGAEDSNSFIIADSLWSLPTLDAEVGTLLLLPFNTYAESDVIIPHGEVKHGQIFIANRPGIVNCLNSNWSIPVRIARKEFAGLLKFRFEEEINNDRYCSITC
jgi:Zn-dependent peptidase ImmA (M78 family)